MDPNGLKVYYTNIRSVKSKITDIQSLIDFDIICLTETHLDNSVHSGELLDSNTYNVYRKDRNIYGGGVLIAVKSNIVQEALQEFASHEAVAVLINRQSIFLCAYRPPANTENRYAECLIESLVNNVSQLRLSTNPSNQLTIVGDFNYPGLDWTGPYPTLKQSAKNTQTLEIFLNTLNEYNLKQVIDEPTHVHGNTLDLLLTNNPSNVSQVVVFPPL